MQTISEAIQEEILDQLHLEICNWSRNEVKSIDKSVVEEKQTFISANDYVAYNHKNILSEIKSTILKKNKDILDGTNTPTKKQL